MRARTFLESGPHKAIAEVPLIPGIVLALYFCWRKDHRSLTFHSQFGFFFTKKNCTTIIFIS
jgi:hypothetical protein